MSIFVVTIAGPAIHECWDFVHAHYASRITEFASANNDHFSHYLVDRQPSCRLASVISKVSGGPQPRRRQKSSVNSGSWASVMFAHSLDCERRIEHQSGAGLGLRLFQLPEIPEGGEKKCA